MRAFAHDVFTYPLPPGHRFPLEKYRLVREQAERLSGVVVGAAGRATDAELGLAHTERWLRVVAEGELTRREELALGLPWSPELVERARRATSATVQAASVALAEGVSANLGGGTHHAFADVGRGFCVFNDVVTAIRVLRRSGALGRTLVIDLDVHQGDGTHELLAGDPESFTLSLNGFRNYPFRRVPGDLDHDFADGTEDDEYLATLDALLAEAIRRARPDLAFVLAGADPYVGDRLGRLALTKAGLRARDALVRELLAASGIPACVTLAGGYAEDIRDTVEINVATIGVFAGAA